MFLKKYILIFCALAFSWQGTYVSSELHEAEKEISHWIMTAHQEKIEKTQRKQPAIRKYKSYSSIKEKFVRICSEVNLFIHAPRTIRFRMLTI